MDENKTVSTETLDDWDDIDFSDILDDGEDAPDAEAERETDTEEQPAADHSEQTETEAEPVETQTETEEKAEADHSFKLKHFGEEKEYSRDETIALAQKGLDYDRIRGKLDEAESRKSEAEEFVNALAQEMGLSPADFMLEARAGSIAKRENISIEEAKRRLDLDRREKALAAKEAEAQSKAAESQAQDARREKLRAELAEFAKIYPNVKVDSLPNEVYQSAASKQIGLTAAYALYLAQEAQAALEAEKQNAQNKALAVGSASTSGKRTPADEFDDAWYDGT